MFDSSATLRSPLLPEDLETSHALSLAAKVTNALLLGDCHACTILRESVHEKILATMLIGAVCAIPSFTFAQEQLSGGSSRLRARLNPVIAVDASGHAELERGAGTNDRFTAEVEIAKDDFDVLDITPGNGFGDEVVLLRVLRDGAEIFRTFLRFSENSERHHVRDGYPRCCGT